MRRVLILGVASIVFVVMSPVAHAGPKMYSYAEAKAAGLPVMNPQQIGIPVCGADPSWRGFKTPEEATFVTENPLLPTCAADPRMATYSTGFPGACPPTECASGYRHAGSLTTGKHYGASITTQVINPNISTSDGLQRFVADRPLEETSTGRWMEGGWMETTLIGDQRIVYGAASDANGYNPVYYSASQFPLVDGNYYVFRVDAYRDIYGINWAVAYVFWNNAWTLIRASQTVPCTTSSGGANCFDEQMLEVYNQANSNSSFPTFAGSVPIGGLCDYSHGGGSASLLHTSSGWVCWNASLYPSSEYRQANGTPNVYPYDACFTNFDWNFVAVNRTC